MPRSSAIYNALFSVMATAFMLGGCQLVPGQTDQYAASPLDDDPMLNAPPITQGLDAKGLSLLIGAELSAQRGDYQRASQGYLDATQRYPVAALAERATYTARFSDQPELLIAATQRWQALAPNTTAPNRLLAALALQQGQWIESLEQRLAITRAGEHADLTALAAFAIAENAPLDALVERLQAHLAAPGNDELSHHTDALIATALLETSLGETQAATRHLDAAAAQGADSRDLGLANARLKMETQDYVNARKAALRGLEDSPGDARLILLLAQSEIRLGNIRAAQHQTDQLLEDHTGGDNLRLALAQLYLEEGYPEPARQLLLPFIGQPQIPDLAYYLLGDISLAEQEIDNALLYYRQVSEGDEFIAARARAAQMLIDNERLMDARAFLRIERMRYDDYYNSLLILEIDLLDKNNQSSEADKLLDHELNRTPDDSTLLYQRAMRAWEAGSLKQLEADLKRLLANDPDNATALNALGYTLADESVAGRLDEAQRLIERAYELDGNNPAVLDSLGWVYYRQGKPERAVQWLQRAFNIMPDQEIAAHLAQVLHALGRSREARELLDAMMQKTNVHPAIDELLKRLPGLTP